MWKKEIDLEEACELMGKSISSKEVSNSRWTLEKEHVVEYSESPTGLAGFVLSEPKSFEEIGILDVNAGSIELYPMKEEEITVKHYVKSLDA